MDGVISGRGELFGQAPWKKWHKQGSVTGEGSARLPVPQNEGKLGGCSGRGGRAAFRVLRGGVAAGSVPVLTFEWGHPLQGQKTAV